MDEPWGVKLIKITDLPPTLLALSEGQRRTIPWPMVQHAFLITAYRDPAALLELLRSLDPSGPVYLHIDRRSSFSADELKALSEYPTVRYVSRQYRVRWGGRAHLLAMLDLARIAVSEGRAERLHLISGSDRPVVPHAEFRAFFEQRPTTEYLLHFPLPTPYWKGGGLDRLTRYHPLDLLDLRSDRQRRLRDLFLEVQSRLGISRSISHLPPLFGGSSWWSLTRNCVQEVLRVVDARPDLLRSLSMTHVPEEVLFPTLVMNSPFASFVVNDHLRYMDWTPRDGNNPAVLDMRDLDAIKRSGKLFARKLDHPASTALIRALDDLVSR